MDEVEKFCENCKRHVSAANFASHSAFCERNVKVCEICDEPYQVALEEDHLEECHAVMPCNLCELPVEKWLLSKHQEVCVKRLIQCDFCDLKLPFDKYREHDDFCGSRTEKCLLCQQYVMLKEKQKHTEFHRHGKKMPKDNSKTKLYRTHATEVSSQLGACKLEETEKSPTFESVARDHPVEPEEQNCVNEAIARLEQKLHDSKDDIFTCLVCKERMPSIHCDTHVCRRENITTAGNEERRDVGVAASIGGIKEDSKHITTCHVCKQRIRWIDYNTHVPTCATDRGRCSVCGERVASGGMKDHMRRCSRNCERGGNRNTFGNEERRDVSVAEPNDSCKEVDSEHFTITCHVCMQRIRFIDYDTHMPTCATDHGRCFVCDEHVASGEMKDHMRRCSKNSHKAEPVDGMKSNLRNSPRPTVPRSSQGACYSESYECPLCSEKIPERDKQKHESFFCKVLLDLDKPYNFSSVTNFDFSKASQERSKKVSSECSVTGSERKHEYKIPEPTKSSGKFKTAEYPRYLEGSASNTFMGQNESKGAMPKYPGSSKIVIPTAGRCKHCKTFLNDDILAIHEEQCIHQEIKCSYCDDAFKLMDADHHTCKWTKVKGKHDRKNSKPKDSNSAGWSFGIGGLFSRKPNFPQDKCERGRNRSYSAITANKFHQTREDTSALHFTQTCIDDTKIPCEFCGELFAVHYLIEHETGCRPDEVSFAKPKPENAANVEERKPDALRRSDRAGQAHVPGGNFFSGSGKPPSSKNKSHKRLQDSAVKPGEFLNINRQELSPQLEDKKNESQLMVKKSNSSAIFSVWNGDSSDEVYEETPSEVSPIESPENSSRTIENGKSVSDGSEEFYSGSDEEVSEMLHFIHDRRRELSKTTVERESACSKSKDDSSTHLNEYKLGMKQGIEDSPLRPGATAATQPQEMPFKEAFDYILNSKEEFLSQDKACWNPSRIRHHEEAFYKEREDVGVNLNENQKVQESFSSAKENDKETWAKWTKSPDST